MQYWRVKAAHLECVLRHAEADAIRDRVFREEGLDPTQRYNLNDQAETATPWAPQGVPAPALPLPVAPNGTDG